MSLYIILGKKIQASLAICKWMPHVNCVNLERAPLKLQRSIMSKGEKKKGEGKKEGKEMGEPQAAV
jgi:hypothetical protein